MSRKFDPHIGFNKLLVNQTFLASLLTRSQVTTKPVNNGSHIKQPVSANPGGSSRPNYNVSFNNGKATNSSAAPKTSTSNKKVSSNTFDDLLGGFGGESTGNAAGNAGKSIGEMKKAETKKTMTAEEALVFDWKEGKSRVFSEENGG